MTDPVALKRHRDRATPEGSFLHHAAADEIEDRIGMVNKPFPDQAIVTGHPDIWRTRFPQATLVPDTDTLALQENSQDLIVHAMSLHWADDPVGQMIQCRRALRPDGLFLAVSYGGQTLQELRACLAQAEIDLTGGLSPRVAPMADLRDQGALLQRAGLALPVADAQPFTVTYTDAWALMRDLRAMGEANALAARLRKPSRRALMDRAADLYAAHYPAEDRRIKATFEMIFLAGWAPDSSQPKPLRPGSASQRLADVLNTDETKLPN
ncbi:MAG: methyltransferase domain-containing protein [Sulfitobacter sp.]|nr:methyltransferase domain-containing protein [Sulfitobacter sp.]